MSTDPLLKIEMRTEDDGDVQVETPWALPLGNDEYELRNSPFFAYDVSFEDVVRATPQSGGGLPLFVGVIRKSGNRTIRIAAETRGDLPPSQAVLDGLVDLGCTYEGANPRYLAINIPSDIGLASVTTFVMAQGVLWEHADPSYETLYAN